MVYFQSIENYGYDKEKEKVDIASLSYEKYFRDSLNDAKEIKLFNTEITKGYEEYRRTSILLKKQFAESGEEATKGKFSDNIKAWFFKVWSFLASIFDKIVQIVVSTIKSMILYIQKHMIMKNSLYTAFKEKAVSLTDLNTNKKLLDGIKKMANGRIKVNTLSIKGKKLDFNQISELINNDMLKYLVEQKIITNNKQSTFNLEILKNTMAHLDAVEYTSNDEKLQTLQEMFSSYNVSHMIYGEKDIPGTSRAQIEHKYAPINQAYLEHGIKGASNVVTYGVSDQIVHDKSDIMEFLGVSDLNTIFDRLKSLFTKYDADSKLVIGKGGYVDVLTEVLKKYRQTAINDTKHIKEMKEYVKKQLDNINSTQTDNSVISNKLKRFTNITLTVQRMKTDFIIFRQNIIGNIFTLFTAEDKALATIIYPKEYSDKEIERIVKETNEKDIAMIGNTGQTQTHTVSFDEQDPSIIDPTVSDEHLILGKEYNIYDN